MTQTLTYSDFSRRVHRQVGERRIPVSVTMEMTHRCPLNCSHCYNNLPMADASARKRELTFGDYCRLLDELADAGSLWLLFTGGEIFARHDFLDIYTYAKKKGFLITLFTNGTMITERVADHLAEWPPFVVEITVYGRTRETYERLTRIPGSYDLCMRGIQLLMERGIPLKLKTVAVSINKHELQDIRKFAEDLGVEFKFDAMMNPRIDCSSSPLAVRLSPQEIVELDLSYQERIDDWRDFSDRKVGPPQPSGQEDNLYHCGGGVESFAIDPYGDMSLCILSHFDKYDLKVGTVAEGWSDFMGRVRSTKVTRPTKCTACSLKAICGMCPANGELENEDPEEPVEFLCTVAHLRAEVFGYEVRSHGECENCEGGNNRAEIVRMATDLREGKPAPSRQSAPFALEAAGGGCSGGCSSCSVQPGAEV